MYSTIWPVKLIKFFLFQFFLFQFFHRLVRLEAQAFFFVGFLFLFAISLIFFSPSSRFHLCSRGFEKVIEISLSYICGFEFQQLLIHGKIKIEREEVCPLYVRAPSSSSLSIFFFPFFDWCRSRSWRHAWAGTPLV